MNLSIYNSLEPDDILQILRIPCEEGVLIPHLISLAEEVEILYPAILRVVILELHIVTGRDLSVGLFPNHPVLEPPGAWLPDLDFNLSFPIHPLRSHIPLVVGYMPFLEHCPGTSRIDLR